LLWPLDASGKSGAHWHHRRYRRARAGNGGGLFRFEIVGQGGFDLSKPFRQIFRSLLTARKRFDMSGKSPA
jgi:hypothetical protein